MLLKLAALNRDELNKLKSEVFGDTQASSTLTVGDLNDVFISNGLGHLIIPGCLTGNVQVPDASTVRIENTETIHYNEI